MSEEGSAVKGRRDRAQPMAKEARAEESRHKLALPMAGEEPAEENRRERAGDPAHPPADARGMDRRHALKVMALAAAAPGLASCSPGPRGDGSTGASTGTADIPGGAIPGGAIPGQISNPNARGDLWDPDLLSPVVPWERQLEADELQSLAALCDVILPADERSPAASEVGAHDFIDEWASAPYEATREGGVLIRGGLVWLDREAHTRYGGNAASSSVRFRDLNAEQQHAICDDICDPERAEGSRFEAPSLFFDRVRYLTLTAFWTTEEGMDDLGYVGNTPLIRWDPPPPEVLRHIGLA